MKTVYGRGPIGAGIAITLVTVITGLLLGCSDNSTDSTNYVWREVADLSVAQPSELWGSSPDDLWTGGISGQIAHYDGTMWDTIPRNDGYDAVLDVWGSGLDDVYFLIERRVIRFDGVFWDTTNIGYLLSSIWGSSPDNIYFAGEDGAICRWEGQRWDTVSLPALETADMNAIWGASDSVMFIVGDSGIVWRFDGELLTVMATPTSEMLVDVWGYGPDDIYAVGLVGVALHFDGTSWERVDVGRTNQPLLAVWGPMPEMMFIAGWDGLFQFDAQEWNKVVLKSFADVYGFGTDHVLAIDFDGTVWRWGP